MSTRVPAPPSFQENHPRSTVLWARQGVAIYTLTHGRVGAGTFTGDACARLAPPWAAAYVQPSRRRRWRYGENRNRLQHYYQFLALINPARPICKELYLGRRGNRDRTLALHDIRFVEDDWESPTLGAWGLGWEVVVRMVWKCRSSPISSRSAVHDCILYSGRSDLRA